MSTPAGPTGPPALLTPDQLTVIVACCSSLVLFVVIVALLSVIYRKDPHCCKVPPYHDSHRTLHTPPQYYSSRQALMGSLFLDPEDYTQDGQLFLVGPPSSYGLPPPDPPLPRLPSYDSVRKRDRQRQIHLMIADRFGLNGPPDTEPPPTYEESVRHSVVPYDVLLPVSEAAEPTGATPGGPAPLGETRPLPPGTTPGGPAPLGETRPLPPGATPGGPAPLGETRPLPPGATPGGPAPHGETHPLPPGATEDGSDLRLPV